MISLPTVEEISGLRFETSFVTAALESFLGLGAEGADVSQNESWASPAFFLTGASSLADCSVSSFMARR